MKTTIITITAILFAASVHAGPLSRSTARALPVQQPVFGENEVSVDTFGFYQDARKGRPYTAGFGGGVGVNKFFGRHFGVGVEGSWSDRSRGNKVIHGVGGSLIARMPIARTRLAPYVFAGGGGRFDSVKAANAHAGGGIEYWAGSQVGLFADGRYTRSEKKANDTTTVRAGIRFAF